jgi:hypothetical protein
MLSKQVKRLKKQLLKLVENRGVVLDSEVANALIYTEDIRAQQDIYTAAISLSQEGSINFRTFDGGFFISSTDSIH